MIMRACALALTVLLTACITGSPQATYVLLSANGAPPGRSPAPRVLLGSVKMPDYLLRNSLVTRVDEYQMQYSSTARWAEPVDIGVQRVLAQLLSAGLDSYGVASFPSARQGDIDWRIEITLRRFETTIEAGLLLADVQIYPASDAPAQSLRIEARRPLADTSSETVAATLSALLEELAERLVAEIEALEHDDVPE